VSESRRGNEGCVHDRDAVVNLVFLLDTSLESAKEGGNQPWADTKVKNDRRRTRIEMVSGTVGSFTMTCWNLRSNAAS
jgi:hypothetical protein